MLKVDSLTAIFYDDKNYHDVSYSVNEGLIVINDSIQYVWPIVNFEFSKITSGSIELTNAKLCKDSSTGHIIFVPINFRNVLSLSCVCSYKSWFHCFSKMSKFRKAIRKLHISPKLTEKEKLDRCTAFFRALSDLSPEYLIIDKIEDNNRSFLAFRKDLLSSVCRTTPIFISNFESAVTRKEFFVVNLN